MCGGEIEHVRPACGTVNSEEAQTCGRNIVELAVAVSQEFIGLFSGRVEGDRVIDLVFYCEGHFFVAAVYGGAGGVEQVLDAFVSSCAVTVFVVLVCACIVIGVAAGFQNIVETDQVALNVDVRMIDRVADAGLCGQINYDGGFVYCKYFVDKGLIGDTSFNKDVPDGRVDRVDHAKAVLLELRVVVVVHVVEADHGAACELAAKAHNQVCADEARGAGDQDGFTVQIDGSLAHCLFLVGVIVAGNRSIAASISAENVSCVDFFLDVVENGIIAVGDDASAHFLEFPEVIDDLGAKESGAVLESGLVNDNGSTLSFDTLHNSLNGGLPEVVRVRLHGQAINADYDIFLLALFVTGVRFTVAVCSGDFQYTVRDKVLPGAVGLDDRFDQVLGHVLVVGEQLLGIFWQAVTAVAKGRIVVVIADARIKADTLNDLSGVQALDLCIGVQFVEVADAQRQISVDE